MGCNKNGLRIKDGKTGDEGKGSGQDNVLCKQREKWMWKEENGSNIKPRNVVKGQIKTHASEKI